MNNYKTHNFIYSFFGCMLVLLIINIVLGGVSFDYCLWYTFGKDISWYYDVLCGFFVGEFTIPLAIIFWIMNLCGIPAPIIDGNI